MTVPWAKRKKRYPPSRYCTLCGEHASTTSTSASSMRRSSRAASNGGFTGDRPGGRSSRGDELGIGADLLVRPRGQAHERAEDVRPELEAQPSEQLDDLLVGEVLAQQIEGPVVDLLMVLEQHLPEGHGERLTAVGVLVARPPERRAEPAPRALGERPPALLLELVGKLRAGPEEHLVEPEPCFQD